MEGRETCFTVFFPVFMRLHKVSFLPPFAILAYNRKLTFLTVIEMVHLIWSYPETRDRVSLLYYQTGWMTAGESDNKFSHSEEAKTWTGLGWFSEYDSGKVLWGDKDLLPTPLWSGERARGRKDGLEQILMGWKNYKRRQGRGGRRLKMHDMIPSFSQAKGWWCKAHQPAPSLDVY